MLAIGSDTVNPTPATTLAPAITGELSAPRPTRSRNASVAAAVIPTGLPTT